MRLQRIPNATKNEFLARDSLNVFARVGGERAARALHQEGLDERVDVAVEDAVDIADLLFRPMILDQLVWMQHVAANLVAEGDVFFRTADLLQFRLLLLQPEIVESRSEDLHRRITIAVLR